VCLFYFPECLLFSLLVLKFQKRRKDGSLVCYDELGYGVILISHDWIRCLVSQFSGRWRNCPKFDGQSSDDLRRLVVANGAIHENGKYSFERRIIVLYFVEIRESPFTHFGGSVADTLHNFLGASLALLSFAR